MITRLILTLLLSVSPLAFAKVNANQAAALHAKLNKEADLKVDYTKDGVSGIFLITNKAGKTEKHPLKTSQKFFIGQKNKKLILVTLTKVVATIEAARYQKELLKIRDFLIACGYQRVVIYQAHGGGLSHPRLDYTEPKK